MRLLFICIFLYFSMSAFAQTHSGHNDGGISQKQDASITKNKIYSKKEEARVPIEVPVGQQEKIGLRVTKVERKKVEHTIRTVGMITADQTREVQVHTNLNSETKCNRLTKMLIWGRYGKKLYTAHA